MLERKLLHRASLKVLWMTDSHTDLWSPFSFQDRINLTEIVPF